MAPIDWDSFMDIESTNLSDDQADELYNVLAEIDKPEAENTDQWQQLFDVTRAIMLIKDAQAKVAMEELEEFAKEQGKEGVINEQGLLDQIKELEEENKRLQRMGGTGGTRDMRSLQNEIHELSRQSDLLQRELKDKERELYKERSEAERVHSRVEEAEKEIRDLKRDNDALRQDLRDYQRQMESQRESLRQRRGDDVEYQDKLRQKNRDINMALDENKQLIEANEHLQKQMEDMTKQLTTATKEMDRIAEDYARIKKLSGQYDSRAQRLKQENEVLKEQIKELSDRLQAQIGGDDEVMTELDKKVEEWKSALEGKDMEIDRLNMIIQQQKDQITASEIDTDKTSVIALSKALQEKDTQLAALRQQLEESAREMDERAEELEMLKNDATKGDAPVVRLQNMITKLRETLKEQEKEMKGAEERAQQAEADARQKDKELSEAINRMKDYEDGEYGLAEAVQEIKLGKKQIALRERNIEQLTQNVNKLEIQLNELLEENEELRSRLGFEPKRPIDMEQARLQRGTQQQQDRALNQVLTKEVERLEEERIALKRQIRALATQRAQRGVALGLTAEEMMEVDEFAEGLKAARKGTPASASGKISEAIKAGKDIIPSDSLRIRTHQLEQEVSRSEQALERSRTQLAEVKAENKKLHEDKQRVEKSMKEILEALKEGSRGGGGQGPVDPETLGPILERLCVLFESKDSKEAYEAQVYLKAQVDQLTGRNEELRRELRQARNETEKASVALDRAQTKIMRLEQDLKDLRDLGQGAAVMTLHHSALPHGLAASSAEIISSLNEQLVQTLQELSVKEDQLGKTEVALQTYRRRFAVLRHQQGLIYQDYQQKVDDWLQREKAWDEEKQKLVDAAGQHEARQQEFNRLLESLEVDGDEQQRRLAEATRKVTVLRVNERTLTRRFTACQEAESTLRKEVNKLRNEMVQMESAITERMGYLQRHKEASQFKISALQRALDESVPAAELASANRQYNDLAAKYRDLLQTDNQLVSRNTRIDQLESDNQRLEEEKENLKRELSLEKEKLHTLEQAMQEYGQMQAALGRKGDRVIPGSETLSLAKRLTTMEMKELNERQRAEHAVRMQNQMRNSLHTLEMRNAELENKFSELTKLNLELQRSEQELRDELSQCVTKAASDMDRRKIEELERQQASLRNENDKLKEMADVASFQTKALEAQQVSRDKEVQSLRQQLLDIQTQSDEKAIIGKLHHHIVALQVSEGTAVRKLQAATMKNRQLEAQALRLQKQLDEKAQSLYHCQVDSRNKARHLRRTIQGLRRQFSGAVPLEEQEKFSKAMIQLRLDKERMEKEMKVLKHEREKVSEQFNDLELKHQGLQELMQTLKDSRGAAKVAEWHAKMQETRLQDMKLNRQITRLQQQVKYFENMVTTHEQTVTSLEQENVHISRQAEERQLLWEQREAELERMIDNLERQQREMADAAVKFEEATGSLPDPSLPVASQLEHSIRTIKMHVKTILDTRAEIKALHKKLSETEKTLSETESNLLSRDRVINELRMRLPASSDRDEVIKDAMSEGVRFKEIEESCEHKQALKVAQTQIEGLQNRIQQKEEALHKYIELLEQSRKEAADESANYMSEIHDLQLKLHAQNDLAFNKFKKAATELVNKPAPPVPGSREFARLQELEDLVAQQDNAMAAMSVKLKAAHTEVAKWKDVLNRKTKEYQRNKERLLEDQKGAVEKLEAAIASHRETIGEKEAEIERLEAELDSQRAANSKAPTTTMKNMVERLKNELALKEKQHKSLSQALLQLRADMVDTAQQNAKAQATEHEQQLNIQKLIDKETKKLKEVLEETQSRLDQARKDVKKFKGQVSSATRELEQVKEEFQKKSKLLIKVESEKEGLEKEVDILKLQTTQQEPERDLGDIDEVSALKRKVRQLEAQVQSSRKATDTGNKKEQSALEVARWEESKKWEKKVESLKAKLKERDREIEQLQKSNKMMKEALNRNERGKSSTTRGEFSATRKIASDEPSSALLAELEDLRRKNHHLQDEISSLQRRQALGHEAVVQELQQKNDFLNDKMENLQKRLEIAERERIMPVTSAATHASAPAVRTAERETELQRQLLDLSQENLELRFEAEQAKRDVPRLRQRVDDLEKYNEALKSDLERERKKSRAAASKLANVSGGTSKKGTSGKSVAELERTVGLMKKVVERVQQENEKLKKAPGVTTQTEIHTLQDENKGLKEELQKLRHQVGGQLSTRYESTQRGVAKAMAENERLRQELQREVDTSQRLRVSLADVTTDKNRLQKQLDEIQEKLTIEQARGPRLEGADSKSWKSIVVTRMYEEKLRGMEQDVEKKNETLRDLRQLLKDSARREQAMLKEIGELREKVGILERFPLPGREGGGGGGLEGDVVQQLQQTRLTNHRLENEKAELLNELKLFRLKGASHGAASTLQDDELVERLHNYNSVMEENVKIRMELQTSDLDMERLRKENERLRKELEQFDPSFFEEIEDLKFNYREVVQRNVQYEEQLRSLGQQFGIQVNIPPS
ncbi:centrosomal protein of 290 kDa-like [Diadema antillarum]|uniref:centrosomal protein of 290 kDa-like n=1 Tax=Diadema antillarum TaxID=105358 RepID=UPI003A85885A